MDDIATYLAEPPVPSSNIKDAGGYMPYWHMASKNRPCVAKMGSDFCSAPGTLQTASLSVIFNFPLKASSVDAERAFSTGRLEINHLQHNMNSQTFKAQMAVGSWAKTPLYPGFSEVTKIIETAMGEETSLEVESV